MIKKDMKSLKKCAKQFSNEEWDLLCEEKDFNNILMEDVELVTDVVERTLKRKVSKPY